MKTKRKMPPVLMVMVAIGLTAGAASAGLIGHYPLDTITGGTTTPDTTGINGPGTLNGGVTLSPGAGKIGGAFSFNGTNGNFVGIQDAGFGQTAFTASVWFQPTSIGAGDPLANWTNSGPSPRTFLIRSSSTALQTYVRENGPTQIGGDNAFPTQSLTTADFNHAVITYDGQSLRTYLNGELSNNVGSFTSSRPIGEGVQGTAAIGGRGSSEGNMNGLVDEVAFWDETLTDGKVAAIFNLADEPALNYDASQADQLFQVFDGTLAEAQIGNLTWTQDSGLGGAAGDVVDLGSGDLFLNLDGTAGVSTLSAGPEGEVPEPATLALLGLAACALGGYMRRRKGTFLRRIGMKTTRNILTVVMMVAAIGLLAVGAQAATQTMTSTASPGPGGSDDDWNSSANWNSGAGPVPSGTDSAVISAGLAAEADTTPPAYSGGLTLGTGSSLRIFGTDAEGAIGSGPITMGAGSDIIMRSNNGSSYTFANTITLLGDAQITGGQSTSGHHCTRNFNGAIGGAYQFSLNGVNNNTMNLNAGNSFDGLVAYSSQNQGWRLSANVADSLGVGDVTINNNVSLIVGADAMDDGATLSLNGAKDSRRTAKLILDSSDTVGAFLVDTVNQGYGTFSSATHPGIIGGAGTLTVPVPPVYDFDGDGYDDPVDWNDGDATIYPGAPELPDLKDNNQDGNVDDGLAPINTMNTDGGGDISWLLGSNWSLGHMPGANDSAVVSAGLNAQVTNLPFGYSGSLTLNENSTLLLHSTGGSANAGALGGAGITMHNGSEIILRLGANVTFPAIHLAGDATIMGGQSTSGHHTSRNFDGVISGPGQLTLDGVNNNTFNLNVANTFDGLIALSTQNQGFRVEANAAGSLGIGDVTINNAATLIIDAADAMDDLATLFLNGAKDSRRDSKLIMNADDTIAALFIDGVDQGTGLFTSASGDWISGLGTLTVQPPTPEGEIPEPATLALLGLAACGLGGYVRRRRMA